MKVRINGDEIKKLLLATSKSAYREQLQNIHI